MSALSAAGLLIAAEINRGVREERQSFQPRAAETVIVGRRRRGAVPPPAAAGRTFEAREAVTVTHRPPHWQGLGDAEAAKTAVRNTTKGE